MAFKRQIQPLASPSARELASQLAGLGMQVAAVPDYRANVEDVLLFASRQGMDHGDLRTLSLLVSWLARFSRLINADRIVRLMKQEESMRVRAFWRAVAEWLRDDRRFARIPALYDGPRVNVLPAGTEFQIERHAEDARFAGTVLRSPEGTLRRRPGDVAESALVIRGHAGLRNRLQMGPSYRSDVWTQYEHEPDLSVADAARLSYASFATAWQVAKDVRLWNTAAGWRRAVEPQQEPTRSAALAPTGAHASIERSH